MTATNILEKIEAEAKSKGLRKAAASSSTSPVS